MTDIGLVKTNYGTVILDYDYGAVTINMEDPGHNHIMKLWEEYFKNVPEVTVLLSGGLDSQFSLFLAEKFCKKVNAITFQYNWDHDIINASDVLLADKLCKKLNIDHSIHEIDVKTFLENDLEDFARTYKCPSPQLCVHLYGISTSNIDGPMLMGGDIPYIGVFNDKVLSSYKFYKEIDESVRRSTFSYFKFYVGPYEVYNEIHGTSILKDPFILTPEIYFLSTKRNLDVLSKDNIILDQNFTTKKVSFERYKIQYYKTFEFEFLYPLKKRTGFENVKTHLASKTGVYNQFDINYRYPILDIAHREKWFGKMGSNFNPNDLETMLKLYKISDLIDTITDEGQKIYDSNSLEICNEYTFEDL